MSPEVIEALEELRRYMFEHMYLMPAVRDEFEKAQRIITALFEHVVAHPEEFLRRRQRRDRSSGWPSTSSPG